MDSSKSACRLAIVTLAVTTIVGPGAVWKWKELEQKKIEVELNSMVSIAGMRSEVVQKLTELVDFVQDYNDLCDRYRGDSSATASAAISNQQARFALLCDDYKALETRLAKIERRPPRPMNLTLPWPSAPSKPLCVNSQVAAPRQ